MEQPEVWKALASPHRRALLDALLDGPRTTSQLRAVLPDLSRFAVMQHLDVLEAAGIVLVRREGRERWNELNAVPIQRELERWLTHFSSSEASRLLAFERHLAERSAPNSKEES